MESEQSDSQQHIRLAAFFLWERRGCPFGTPEIDWFRAEEEIRTHTDHPSGKPALVAMAESVGSALGKVAGLAGTVSH